MFGIGLPEMILIMALALIVVGPDKLPELARSLAKGLMELKKTAESLKDQLNEDGNPLDELKPDLEEAAKTLKENLLESPPHFDSNTSTVEQKTPAESASEAYQELLQQTTQDQEVVSVTSAIDQPVAYDSALNEEPARQPPPAPEKGQLK